MTSNQLIEQHTKELQNITEKIKTEMDLFYESNIDSNDLEYALKRFKDDFNVEVGNFDYQYNMSLPENLLNTPFEKICISNSISIYLDLSNHYNSILEKLHSKFLETLPPLDDSLVTED